MPTEAEAFAALRRGGLKHDDPDLVRFFGDTDSPTFVQDAKAKHPDLFHFDAMKASRAEVDARSKELQVAERQRQRDLAPKPTPGFNALKASKEEYEAELRRLGIRRMSLR